MKDFRTYQLAEELAKKCKTMKLKQPHQDQFQRAVLSIALNLAEGSAKPTTKDQKKFYYTALGSLREVQSLIRILDLKEIESEFDKLGAHLFKLCRTKY